MNYNWSLRNDEIDGHVSIYIQRSVSPKPVTVIARHSLYAIQHKTEQHKTLNVVMRGRQITFEMSTDVYLWKFYS